MVEISKRGTWLVRKLPLILAINIAVALLGILVAIPLFVRPSDPGTGIDIRKVPDVVIERESFRRFGLLNPEVCTYCGESWRTCTCEMGKHPLMFQNRQQQSVETIRAELLKYNVKLDK